MKNVLTIPILIGALFLSMGGCNLYRIDVQQGNFIQQKEVDQLHPGMDREQVKNIMGTPLIRDPFHPERWDYVYTFKSAYGKRAQRHVTLFFNADGKLARISGDVVPAAPPANAQLPADAAQATSAAQSAGKAP